MIKVECLSCRAPYDLDPKRIPDKGMKMRCPKCGASFMVSKDGSTSSVAAPQAAPPLGTPTSRTQIGTAAQPAPAPMGAGPRPAPIAPPPPAASAPIAPPFTPKATMLGHHAPGNQASRPQAAAAATGSLIPPAGGRTSGSAMMQPPAKAAPKPNSQTSRNAAAKGAFGGTLLGAGPAFGTPSKSKDLPPPVFESNEDGFAADVELPDDLPPPPQPSPDDKDLSVSRMYVDDLPAPRGEVDLPAPRINADLPARKAAAGSSAPDLSDLPRAKPQAPRTSSDEDVASGYAFGDLDLPAPKVAADLPGLKAPAPAASAFGDLDLLGDSGSDLDLPTVRGAYADLPAAKEAADLPAFRGSADLPAPRTGADLPTPKGLADLPTAKGTADLPSPKNMADLPLPKNLADLPVPSTGKDLPSRKLSGSGFGELDLDAGNGGAGFGDLDLPAAKGAPFATPPRGGEESSFADLDLPDLPLAPTDPPHARRGGGFGDIELPPPKPAADLIPPKAKTVQGMGARGAALRDEASFGDVDIEEESDSDLPPSLLGADESSFSDLSFEGGRPMPAARAKAPPNRPLAAPLGEEDVEELEPDAEYPEPYDAEPGDDFAEEDFDGEGEDDASEEEMEFGISGDEARGLSLPPEILRRQRGEEFEAKQAALGKRTVTIVVRLAVLLVLLAGVGAGLKFTEYGVFGIYYLERYLPEAGDPQLVRSAIEKSEKIAASDTYSDVIRSLNELGDARGKAGLNRELLTRSLAHHALFILRFGEDAKSAAHAAAIMKRLEERSFRAPAIELARGAEAARRGKWDEAERFLSEARTKSGRDPYVELIAGEAALAQGKLDQADKAFAKALSLGGGARAQWGTARVVLQRGERNGQIAAVNETLKLSPMHVDARLAEARILWDQGKEDRSLHQLRVALGLEPTEDDQHLWSSKQSVASGYALLGYIQESKGRLHAARSAYEQALAADPYRVDALLGSGRVLLREKRHNDALGRFESALNAATKGGQNPIVLSGRKADSEAQLGVGRALLALDRGQEAKAKLEQLSTTLPNDPDIVLALGETEEALGNPQPAEAQFRKSIELAPKRFDGYLALSQLFFRKGDAGKASEILNEAALHVEETAQMRQMLGQSELARNRLESAVHEFKRALELDPHALDAMFGMATALRKRGDLDAAAKALDEIGRRDPGFAGLAEQKGLLFEAQGEPGKAVQAYRDALEKDPGDNGLLLRLGAAQVAAGNLDEAEQTLAKVIREMPNSAEAEYFIGRVAFGRGRTPDALTHFDRAVSLDGTRGEYHLYVARASFDMNDVGRAYEEVLAALNFDPNLGDAYWVRAMVRLRQGAVKDALRDLNRALKLNPSRIEAYATMGESYEQLRQLPEAIRAYRTGLESQPQNGQWWYKLTILHADSGQRGEAESTVKRAIEIGDKTSPMPYWLPDSYRLAGELAETRRDRTGAIRMYKRYIEIATPAAIDRNAIEEKLEGWGVQIEEDEY